MKSNLSALSDIPQPQVYIYYLDSAVVLEISWELTAKPNNQDISKSSLRNEVLETDKSEYKNKEDEETDKDDNFVCKYDHLE